MSKVKEMIMMKGKHKMPNGKMMMDEGMKQKKRKFLKRKEWSKDEY